MIKNLNHQQLELLELATDASINIEEAELVFPVNTIYHLKKLVALGYLTITELGDYQYTGKSFL